MSSSKLTQSLDDFVNRADDVIVERGRDYYKNKYIESLSLSSNGRFNAEVSGSSGECYNVYITTEDGFIVDYGCDCPYDYDDVCKHIVAVCLAIKEGDYTKTRKKSNKNDLNLRAVLNSISPEKLKEFLLKYAQNNVSFKNELLFAFANPEPDLVATEVKERVREIMRVRSDCGFIDYGNCNYICNAFCEILERSNERLSQGHVAIAFSIAMLILLKCAHMLNSADSSSGALSNALGYAFEIIDKCCKNAVLPEDEKLIYKKCVKEALNKEFSGWGGFSYQLLECCAVLVNEKNVEEIEKALYKLGNVRDNSTYYRVHETLVRLKITRRLKGEDACDAEIKQNLRFEEVRKIAIERALEKRDFDYAEALCLERLDNLNDDYHWTRAWYKTLYEIYVLANDCDKQISLARDLFVNKSDFEYYRKLKEALIANGKWEKAYSCRPAFVDELRKTRKSFCCLNR